MCSPKIQTGVRGLSTRPHPDSEGFEPPAISAEIMPKTYPETSWINPKIEIRSSSIHGQGMFTQAGFEAGEIVAISGGVSGTKQEAEQEFLEWEAIRAGPADLDLCQRPPVLPRHS